MAQHAFLVNTSHVKLCQVKTTMIPQGASIPTNIRSLSGISATRGEYDFAANATSSHPSIQLCHQNVLYTTSPILSRSKLQASYGAGFKHVASPICGILLEFVGYCWNLWDIAGICGILLEFVG
jgi:hypothetical protein